MADVTLHGKLSADTLSLNGTLNAQVTTGGIQLSDLPLGHALIWDAHGRLAVEMATEGGEDNTLPVTAAAVQTAIGNIDVLLQTI